jgi:type VI protein secretion system component Hcp
MKLKKIFLGIVAIACLWSFTTADSYQMFFKMEGIQGETSFRGEEGWTNVLTWEWASGRSILEAKPIISVTGTSYTGPKMESVGSLDGLGIKFSKWVDKSSAALISFFEKKIKIPSAKLCLLSVIGEKETTWTFELENVMVTSHAQEGNRETFTLNYGKIEWR